MKKMLIEGMTSVRAVIKAIRECGSDRRISRVFVDRQRSRKRSADIKWLGSLKDEMGFSVEYLDSDGFGKIAGGKTNGGIAAEVSDRTFPPLSDIRIPQKGFFAILDGIEDPYNFGDAVRSLYLCGCDCLVMKERNWMSAAATVIKASAGTSELMQAVIAEPEEAVCTLKSAGYRVVCAGIRDSVPCGEADLARPLLLIIGGEKRGISASVLSMADLVVRISYGREFRGSLSAQSAAAVLSYEIMKQNSEAGM